jgi:hypothetical protein
MFVITITGLLYERFFRKDHFEFSRTSKCFIFFTLIVGNAVCEAAIDYLGVKLFQRFEYETSWGFISLIATSIISYCVCAWEVFEAFGLQDKQKEKEMKQFQLNPDYEKADKLIKNLEEVQAVKNDNYKLYFHKYDS